MSELNKALVKAQGAFPAIDLDRTVKVVKAGKHLYSFDYATLANIKRKTDPSLHENGLCIVHLRDGDDLVSTLLHTSGESLISTMPLRIPKGSTQQEEGSVVTYAKRYNTAGLLGIVADEDDDANVADGNSFKAKPTPPKPTPSKFIAKCKEAAGVLGADECKAVLKKYKFDSIKEVTKQEDKGKVVKALCAAMNDQDNNNEGAK